jgi:hypothetical protein
MGANHRMTLWSQRVGKEQMAPNRHRTRIASKTVCTDVLRIVSLDREQRIYAKTYGAKLGTPLLSSIECMTAVARIIWEMVYARLATPPA